MTRAGCSDLNWPLLCTRYSKNDTIESRMSTRYSSKSSFSEFRTSPLSFSPRSSNSKRTGLCGRKLIIHQRMNLAPRKLRSNFSSSRGNTKRAINKRYPRKTLKNGGIPRLRILDAKIYKSRSKFQNPRNKFIPLRLGWLTHIFWKERSRVRDRWPSFSSTRFPEAGRSKTARHDLTWVVQCSRVKQLTSLHSRPTTHGHERSIPVHLALYCSIIIHPPAGARVGLRTWPVKASTSPDNKRIASSRLLFWIFD